MFIFSLPRIFEIERLKNGENRYYSPEFDMLYKTISGLLNISITISKYDSLISNQFKVNKFINRLSKKISKEEGIGFQK